MEKNNPPPQKKKQTNKQKNRERKKQTQEKKQKRAEKQTNKIKTHKETNKRRNTDLAFEEEILVLDWFTELQEHVDQGQQQAGLLQKGDGWSDELVMP